MTRADLLKGIQRWRFVPAGVADPAGRRLFVSDDRGGVAALVAETGERAWSSGDVNVPLLGLTGALLAASRDGAVPCILEAASGEALLPRFFEPLPIPSGPWSPAAVWRDGQQVFVAWTSRYATGVASIDFESGRVAAAEPPAQPPLQPANVLSGIRLFRSADGTAAPWRAGDRIAALAIDEARGKERLRLMTWSADRGQPLKNIELAPSLPRAGYLQHHRSPDADFVFLLACNDNDRDGAPAGTVCNWSVFRVSDGKKVAAFPSRPGLQQPLAVIGNRLLYIEMGAMPGKREMPLRRLCALDTASARLAWTHDLGQAAR